MRWIKDVPAPPEVIRNIQALRAKQAKNTSSKASTPKKSAVSSSEKMPKLTAKVFRTWRCTKTVREELEKSGVIKEDPDYKKVYAAKMANFKVAEVANHKRKVPPTFDQRLEEERSKPQRLEAQLVAKKAEGKKTESLETRIEKAKLDLELTKLTKEYNLGTSLKSYIDPTAYVKWAKKVKFDIEKFYPKTLRNKFSWALQSSKAQAA